MNRQIWQCGAKCTIRNWQIFQDKLIDSDFRHETTSIDLGTAKIKFRKYHRIVKPQLLEAGIADDIVANGDRKRQSVISTKVRHKFVVQA